MVRLSRLFFYKNNSDIKVLQPQQKLVWADPFSLAATKGISVDLFSTATKMFQFAAYPLPSLFFQLGVTRHYSSRVSPFGNPWVNAC